VRYTWVGGQVLGRAEKKKDSGGEEIRMFSKGGKISSTERKRKFP